MHFAHAGGSALAFADSLNDGECFFVDDCLMSVLEDLPFRWVVLELLLLLGGFASHFEGHGMSKIFLSG